VLTYAGSQPEKNNIDELEKMAQYSVGLKLYSSATTGNQKEYNARDFEEIVRKWHEVAPDKPIMLHSGARNVYGFIRLIARKYQHQLHVCHVNSVREVRFISKAKNRGLPVTCGICPHHLFLTSHNEVTQGWFARMQPPLAKEKETEELFRLFVEGAIDILETDHAPHQIKNKWAAEEGEGACYGVPGIEFALPLLFYQMKQKRITLRRIIEATSTKPAQIIGVKLPTKTTVTWKMQPYRINESMVSSKSGWSPFNGMLAVGRVEEVTIGGKSIVKSGQIRTKVSGLALN
jgi:dihydroorotase-like cyclic amidohydrolase